MRKLAPVTCLLILCFAAEMKAQIPSSTISGIVKDSEGALIEGATVEVTSEAQGTTRKGETNSDGSYSIPDLAPGKYLAEVSSKGFATAQYARIALEAGHIFTLDATLTPADQVTTVKVTAENQTVDVAQSMLQGQVTENTIENIPLNGRNFLELAYLIPGNRPAPTFDPTKTNTLEISSAGGFGRGGNITVDGGDNNDEVVGGTLANFPEDSVKEFQIATGRFTAEVGRSGNSIVNIVTKSGTNSYHGSAFIFERNRNLQALPATFNRSLPTPPFDREQTGGSIGGPIKRDRAWMFASFEFRDQNASLQTGTRDFASQQVVHSAAPAPLRDALLSGRFDDQLSEHNSMMVRYSFNRSTDTAAASPGSSAPSFTSAERQNSLNRFNSVVANVNSALSPTKVNDLSFHFDNFYNDIPAVSQ